MELKHIIPNVEKTFGNLEYAGEGRVEYQRVNGQRVVATRNYNLYSDIQRADDVIIKLAADAGEKYFKVRDKVKLVNARIVAEGYKIGIKGFTNYVLYADDMVKI